MPDGPRESDIHESIPIPTYEEATTARPSSSSHAHRGATEISDDAERQGLLHAAGAPTGTTNSSRRRDGYQAPTAESERSSSDSDLYLPEVTEEDEDASLRRDMEELEIQDPITRRSTFAKHFNISYLTSRLPSLPSFRIFPLGCFSCSCFRLPEGCNVSIPIVARLVGLALIALFVWSILRLSAITSRRHFGQRYDPERVRQIVQGEADADRIADYLRYISSFDHVAGTEGDLYLARWIGEQWKNAGLENVETDEYFAYINYATDGGRRVKITEPATSVWEAPLEEAGAVFGAHTLNWHAHSRNGSANGHLVYANGGSRADFQKLKDMGVEVRGCVAIVRQHHMQEDMALKAKAAEEAGASAVLFYSDPKEDGSVRGQTFREGPWRPRDSLQRGSVGLTDWVLGDPLTPGRSSEEGTARESTVNNPGLINIPTHSLSVESVWPLLLALQTHGQKVSDDWVGGVDKVASWWTGGKTAPKILIENIQDENEKQRIWNVRGMIEGMESRHRVVVGNHRDAWCRGAADPGSGTAVLMEVVGILGKLRDFGWRPLRTIEFFSWDAKEFGMIGSTEHVEKHAEELRKNTVGYINVDVGATGQGFRANASPEWTAPLMRVLERVKDPNSDDKTLRDLFQARGDKLELLDSRSDYVPFRDIVGAASIDIGFTGPKYGYPKGSCYDLYDWMDRFGDPGSKYMRALAEVWALLILELADKPIVPYDLRAFASSLHSWLDDLEGHAKSHGLMLNMDKLSDAAKRLTENTEDVMTFEDKWTSQVLGMGGFESDFAAVDRDVYNDKMLTFQKDLLDLPGRFDGDDKQPHGIPGREQYKHVIFGPALWTNTSGADTFAAVRDAIADGDIASAQERADKAAALIARAADNLLAR